MLYYQHYVVLNNYVFTIYAIILTYFRSAVKYDSGKRRIMRDSVNTKKPLFRDFFKSGRTGFVFAPSGGFSAAESPPGKAEGRVKTEKTARCYNIMRIMLYFYFPGRNSAGHRGAFSRSAFDARHRWRLCRSSSYRRLSDRERLPAWRCHG